MTTKRKRSLFERLTGTLRMEESDDLMIEDTDTESFFQDSLDRRLDIQDENMPLDNYYEEDQEGELAIDMYRDGKNIIVQAMTAGVEKGDLDVTITRESVTIRGKRNRNSDIDDDQYILEELYWGTFSRMVQLPEEIDVELSEAKEAHGLLTIICPLIDREKEARLKVK